MKQQFNQEIIELNSLKPILSIFILFFIVTVISVVYIESLTFKNQNNEIFFLILLISIFSIVTFFIIKYISNKFYKNVNNIYTQNLKLIQYNKKYLQAVEDSSQNFIITAIGDKIERVNKSFLNFTGYQNLSDFYLEHTCISELFVTKEGYLSNKINGEHWFSYVTNRPNILHKAILKKDNTEYIFIVETNEINIDEKQRSITSLINITEFENLQTRFKLAINGTKDGLWDWDLVTNQVYFSAQWKKQLGYEDNELDNKLVTWEERVHPDDLKQAYIDIQSNIDKKTPLYENQHRLKHKNGSWIWILDRGQTIYDENGKPIRMVGFHTDITEKKQIEQELHDKDEMMIAQSRNAAMGEMISMIAHQWRQPLSVISMGANNIMADIELEILDEKNLKNISEEIIIQTNELSNTIDDFRNFFQPKKEKEYISVNNIINDAIKIIKTSLDHNNVELHTSLIDTKKINTYSRELLQVILNILKNAKEMFVENNVEKRDIFIDVIEHQNHLEVEIKDNAGGIPQNVLSKIFDPYFTTKNEQNGTGLGLYMCKIIVEKHLDGELIASNWNNGASFKIKLRENNNE